MPEEIVTFFSCLTVVSCINVQQSQEFIFSLYYKERDTAENDVLGFLPLTPPTN